MDSTLREQRIASAFVELADTLVADFDVIELLHRLSGHCVDLLDVEAAGLMLVNQRGQLQTAAASDERSWLLELLELQHREGPCLDTYGTGTPVPPISLDSREAKLRWPQFAAQAQQYGFEATYAVPLRLRENVIGALNLFMTKHQKQQSQGQVTLAQALADAATIGILQQRTIQQSELLAEQLQSALTSRIRVEQAKGMLAERWGVSVDEAFEAMRRYARTKREPLSRLAQQIADGSLPSESLREAADGN